MVFFGHFPIGPLFATSNPKSQSFDITVDLTAFLICRFQHII